MAEPFQLIPTVPQPLWHLGKEKEVVEVVLANKMPMASCRQNYYAGLMLHNLSP